MSHVGEEAQGEERAEEGGGGGLGYSEEWPLSHSRPGLGLLSPQTFPELRAWKNSGLLACVWGGGGVPQRGCCLAPGGRGLAGAGCRQCIEQHTPLFFSLYP